MRVRSIEKVDPTLTKAELQARVEKLERANVQLRAKNKALTRVNLEISEALDELKADPPVEMTLVPRHARVRRAVLPKKFDRGLERESRGSARKA